jgi:hypothetical protein
MKWFVAYLRFLWRTFVLGAHGLVISWSFFAVDYYRKGEYEASLIFGLVTIPPLVFLMVWWRNHLRISN